MLSSLSRVLRARSAAAARPSGARDTLGGRSPPPALVPEACRPCVLRARAAGREGGRVRGVAAAAAAEAAATGVGRIVFGGREPNTRSNASRAAVRGLRGGAGDVKQCEGTHLRFPCACVSTYANLSQARQNCVGRHVEKSRRRRASSIACLYLRCEGETFRCTFLPQASCREQFGHRRHAVNLSSKVKEVCLSPCCSYETAGQDDG